MGRSITLAALCWAFVSAGVARGQPVVTITAPADGVNVCVGDVVAFAGNSVPACMTYTWNWGDGTPNSNGMTANHTFTRPSAFTVRFTATPAGGGMAGSTTI